MLWSESICGRRAAQRMIFAPISPLSQGALGLQSRGPQTCHIYHLFISLWVVIPRALTLVSSLTLAARLQAPLRPCVTEGEPHIRADSSFTGMDTGGEHWPSRNHAYRPRWQRGTFHCRLSASMRTFSGERTHGFKHFDIITWRVLDSNFFKIEIQYSFVSKKVILMNIF